MVAIKRGDVVSFIGLDDLSLELAASLLLSGYGVQAFDEGPLIDDFLKLGGIRCTSLMEASKDAAALVIFLPNVDQINDKLLGQEDLNKDTVIILRSTKSPAYIQKLEKLLKDGEKAFVVDANVTRGMSEFSNGKLMIISSGRPNANARAHPILSAMCDALYVFEDDVGAVSKINMVNELLAGIHLVASLEAITLGVRAGIHPLIL